MTTLELRKAAVAGQERLQHMQDNLPQTQIDAARAYLDNPLALVSIAALQEFIVPGLELLARAAEGRDLLIGVAAARERLAALPPRTSSADDRALQQAANAIESAQERLMHWQNVNWTLPAEAQRLFDGR